MEGERESLTKSKEKQRIRVPGSEASQYSCLCLQALWLQANVTTCIFFLMLVLEI